jgi:hypothetical protein
MKEDVTNIGGIIEGVDCVSECRNITFPTSILPTDQSFGNLRRDTSINNEDNRKAA